MPTVYVIRTAKIGEVDYGTALQLSETLDYAPVEILLVDRESAKKLTSLPEELKQKLEDCLRECGAVEIIIA